VLLDGEQLMLVVLDAVGHIIDGETLFFDFGQDVIIQKFFSFSDLDQNERK